MRYLIPLLLFYACSCTTEPKCPEDCICVHGQVEWCPYFEELTGRKKEQNQRLRKMCELEEVKRLREKLAEARDIIYEATKRVQSGQHGVYDWNQKTRAWLAATTAKGE